MVALACGTSAPVGIGEAMNKLLFALPLIAMIGACDSSPKVEAQNASVEDVAKKVRAANGDEAMVVRPGKWRSNVVLETLDIPGMPPEAAAQIKKTMATQATGNDTCLTPEQARRPKEDFFAGKSSNCRYDKFSMDDGHMSGTMRCAQPSGVQLIQFDGNYAPESYDMHMVSTVEGSGPGGSMKMAMKISAKRIGDCDAKTAGASK